MAQDVLSFLISFFFLFPSMAPNTQVQRAGPSSVATRAEIEEFLLKASIVGERDLAPGARQSWRITLDDGRRKHDALVETAIGSDSSQRDYRFNVAAYELDKELELHLVSPSVERTVKGQPAAITWWVDDVLMNEMGRRSNNIEPPNTDSWNKQMQGVRVFDELISNAYRNISPAFYRASCKTRQSGHFSVLQRSAGLLTIKHFSVFRYGQD